MNRKEAFGTFFDELIDVDFDRIYIPSPQFQEAKSFLEEEYGAKAVRFLVGVSMKFNDPKYAVEVREVDLREQITKLLTGEDL